MPRPPILPAQSSAIVADLATRTTHGVGGLPSGERRGPQRSHPATVRREFAISRQSDDFITATLIPYFREIAGVLVNRSVIMRAVLTLLHRLWTPTDAVGDTKLSDVDRVVLEELARCVRIRTIGRDSDETTGTRSRSA